jgi:predicted AlkP superfamily phosphohydrolase/phosphomutase
MFMRFLDEDHPARPRDGRADRYRDVIADTYARCDRMLGRLFEAVPPDRPENLVVVLSDHGFKTFRRGMNVNAWLLREGYLVLKDGRTASGEWWEGVDWDRTRAYGLGLAGIWLNVRGRERQGCVEPADQQALASEIAGKLSGLCDDAGPVAVNRAWTAAELPAGPYTERSPDIVVGYAEGYRASWAGVRGIADGVVFDDNDKAWSGDHCIDPSAVPGVLLANRPLASGRDRASIADLAPTLLETFGVARPGWMDGSSLAP